MSALRVWKRDVWSVLRNPGLVLAMALIGSLLVWLANLQVRYIFWILLNLGLTNDRHADVLKEQRCLSAFIILGLIWTDLYLLNFLALSLSVIFNWCAAMLTKRFHNQLKAAQANLDGQSRLIQSTQTPRRNAFRACRRISQTPTS